MKKRISPVKRSKAPVPPPPFGMFSFNLVRTDESKITTPDTNSTFGQIPGNRKTYLRSMISIVQSGNTISDLQIQQAVNPKEYAGYCATFRKNLYGKSSQRCPSELKPYLDLAHHATEFYKRNLPRKRLAYSCQLRECHAEYQEALECLGSILMKYPGAEKFLVYHKSYGPGADIDAHEYRLPRLHRPRALAAKQRIATDSIAVRELLLGTLQRSLAALELAEPVSGEVTL